MIYMDEQSLNTALRKLQKFFSVVLILSRVCLIIFTLLWLLLFILLLLSFFSGHNQIVVVLHTFVVGVSVFMILLNFSRMFNDAIRNQSPFTRFQSRRLLIIGLLIAIMVFNDAFLPVNQTIQFNNSYFDFGFAIEGSSAVSDPTLNVGVLFFSLFLICLSAVFHYGYLLQQLNDDTV